MSEGSAAVQAPLCLRLMTDLMFACLRVRMCLSPVKACVQQHSTGAQNQIPQVQQRCLPDCAALLCCCYLLPLHADRASYQKAQCCAWIEQLCLRRRCHSVDENISNLKGTAHCYSCHPQAQAICDAVKDVGHDVIFVNRDRRFVPCQHARVMDGKHRALRLLHGSFTKAEHQIGIR
eukprot:3874187-Amphidinium_carterae.2